MELQTLENGISHVSIVVKDFLYFLHADRYADSELLDFIHIEWKKNYDKNIISSPLYISKAIEAISLNVIRNWIYLEKFFHGLSKNDIDSGSNLLITGTKGVGKTTLMQGLKLIIDANSQNVITAYVDYEQETNMILPSEYLLQFIDDATTLTTHTFNCWARKHKKGLFFFGDEIQELYKDQSKVSVVREILSLGKSGFAMGIISGSSSNVRSLAHKEIEDERYLIYPNLNHSVYVERNLNPLRTENELNNFLKEKSIKINIGTLKIFQLTGGVGREINRAIMMENIENFVVPDILPKMESNAKFCSLVRIIYNKFVLRKDKTTAWEQPSISFAEIQQLGVTEYINQWRDEGYLFKCDNSLSCELLVPEFFRKLEIYYLEKPKALYSLAFETVIRGWEGNGSAGQLLESYIIERYIKSKIPPFEGREFSNERITTAENPSGANDANVLSMTNTKLEYLINRVLSFTKDIGIDAVILDQSTDNVKDSIDITAIQIKSGMLTESISMGSLNKSPSPSRHFAAIVNKADKACIDMLKLFRHNYEGSTFAIKKFILLTSKKVSKDVLDLSSVNIGNNEVNFECLDQTEFVEAFKYEIDNLCLKF